MTFTDLTDCPYYLISRASLTVTASLKKAMGRAGVAQVRPAYLGVLMTLWQEDGLKVNECGRRAGLEPSTMTGLIDRMERDGLVVRAADPEDRRAHRIELTTHGHELRQPALAVVDQVITRIFGGISDEELEISKKVLRNVLQRAHGDRT